MNGKKAHMSLNEAGEADNRKRPFATFLGDYINTTTVTIQEEQRLKQPFVNTWLESLYGSSSKRSRRYSDSFQPSQTSKDDIKMSMSRPASEPNAITDVRDDEGFVIPPTPSAREDGSVREWESGTRSESVARSGRLVADPDYRYKHLLPNNIVFRGRQEQLPNNIENLVTQIRRRRSSPGPSEDDIANNSSLQELEEAPGGASESQVQLFFRGEVFHLPGPASVLQTSHQQVMAKRTVPIVPDTYFKVSGPVPDLLYGYKRAAAFNTAQMSHLFAAGTIDAANAESLTYPFLLVEFKGDGASGAGSLWLGTNQCLGGSAACVNIIDRLYSRLKASETEPSIAMENATFSITMSGTEARLFVSWRNNRDGDGVFYMQKLQSFCLQEPLQFIEFRKMILNIIQWGEEERLSNIRKTLDFLIEDDRNRASEAAKNRPMSPSDAESSRSRGRARVAQRSRSASSRRSRGSSRG